MESWAWTALYNTISWSNSTGTSLFGALGQLGDASALLWPLALAVVRLIMGRQLPGPRAPILLALLGLVVSHCYMTPLYHEWARQRAEDSRNSIDYKRFCFQRTPLSLTFIKACIDTEVELHKWPIVRAHANVVSDAGGRLYSYATTPLMSVGLLICAVSALMYAKRVVLPALEHRRLVRHHASASP